MSKIMRKSYTLQFTSPPPPFNGVLESVISSKAETAALMMELMELIGKGVISGLLAGEKNIVFYS